MAIPRAAVTLLLMLVAATTYLVAPSPVMAQVSEEQNARDACDEFLTMLDRDIEDAWDDIDKLRAMLNTWDTMVQESMTLYSVTRLRGLTGEDVAEMEYELYLLKFCLPPMSLRFERLRDRIRELDIQIEGRPDRAHERRIQELEQLHEEVKQLLAALSGRTR